MPIAPPIDAKRLWHRLEALSALTEPHRPWTRRSFSPLFNEGRAYLRDAFEAAGLETRIDAGGNLVGRRAGLDPALKPILVGSHSDTVPSGGRYDGVLGVLAALEIAEGTKSKPLRHPLEVYDFLAEEPSEFGLSCIGSRALAGQLTAEMLEVQRADGLTLGEAIRDVGGAPEQLAKAARPKNSTAAYVELHIEQGRVLENAGIPIGIVTDIVGIKRVRLDFIGRADHAGATPMHLREDALVAAARVIDLAYRSAHAVVGRPLVATVGQIEAQPNAANAVPGHVTLTLEIRSGDAEAVEAFQQGILAKANEICAELGVRLTCLPISLVAPTPCAAPIRAAIAEACGNLGLASLELPSGAGHDGMFVARTGPIGMIFVPCREGRSHAPEEWIEPEQATQGATALAETVHLLDTRLDPVA